jgi:hypothetical protein
VRNPIVQSKFNFDARFIIYRCFKFQFILHVDDVSNICAMQQVPIEQKIVRTNKLQKLTNNCSLVPIICNYKFLFFEFVEFVSQLLQLKNYKP